MNRKDSADGKGYYSARAVYTFEKSVFFLRGNLHSKYTGGESIWKRNKGAEL